MSTSIPSAPPPSLTAFTGKILPLIHRSADARRMIDSISRIIQTDRWNSFDRWHDTTQMLKQAYESAGATVQIHQANTGGNIGNGRWVVQEAADVHGATVDIIAPVRRRLLDWNENPWHVAQWSAATPKGGIECDLVIIDTEEELNKWRPQSMVGRAVLTKLNVAQFRTQFYDRGASAVISDLGVPNLPDATQWLKLGWGGFDLATAAARIVALAISPNAGAALRELHNHHIQSAHKGLRLHVTVDIRKYSGTHDVVSGIVKGRLDTTDEVWAVAHSCEPGALDNASGVACCIEIARLLEELILCGELPRPRRSIRFINAYECYGFFHQYEFVKRLQPPLAGVCVDTIGARPDLCEGHLRWHATVPSSASFANDLGEIMLRETMAIDSAGYHYQARPFLCTEDTLMGDPHYGFPMPWITNHPFVGYHSSADVLDYVHGPGMVLCAAALAGYLYYLADAGTDEALEIAHWQTQSLVEKLQNDGPRTPAQAEVLRIGHQATLERAKRMIWGGDRQEILAAFSDCHRRIAGAATAAATLPAVPLGEVPLPVTTDLSTVPPAPVTLIAAAYTVPPLSSEAIAATLRKIPVRRRLLAPTAENTFPHVAPRMNAMPKWAHYFADGNRTVEQMAQLMGAALNNRTYRADAAANFFNALAELGYVDLVAPEEMSTVETILGDLRKLGVQAGMDLMVHSSMSKIGAVRGGAEAVVDALLAAIGPTGTLLAPSFNFSQAWAYNPLATPTVNGAIADALWRRPAALRSDQPSHAVAAIGPRAGQYLADHAANGIWAKNSPIGRLVHSGGYVLVIGDVNEPRTIYHIAEIANGAPCLDMFGNLHRLVQQDGTVREVPGLAWRAGSCPVNPKRLDPALDEANLQTKGRIGRATATLAKAIDVYNMRLVQLGSTCATCPVRPGYR